MEWTRFEVTIAAELQETLADFFVQQGSNGVVVEDRDTDSIAVVAYIPRGREAEVGEQLEEYLSSLKVVFPEAAKASVSQSVTPDENWAVAWRDHFKPVYVGRRFVITPPWISPDRGSRSVIIIEPADAFGTGTHETTQSCIVLMERVVERLGLIPGRWTMLDVGCGSGILAFAAYGLSAGSIVALDSDPKAIASAVRNARLNGLEKRIQFVCASIESLKGPADVVAANLDARTLTTHAGSLARVARRALVVSGILSEQWSTVSRRFQSEGLLLEEEIASREWGSGLFVLRKDS